MPPVDSCRRLKRLRILGDVLEPDCREISEHEPEVEDDSIGLSIVERRQRKLKRVVIYSDDEDETYIDTEKPNNEPEPELESCDVAWRNINNDVIDEIICRASWTEISVFKCLSRQLANTINSTDFLLQLRKRGNKEPELLAGIFYIYFLPKTMSRMQVKFNPILKWSNMVHVDELKSRGLNALTDMQFLPKYFHIQDCRHGLLLCTFMMNRTREYYVCNPITRKHSWLREPPESSYRHWETAFLVDKETGHYKVIQMPLTYNIDLVGEEGFTEVHVYSSLLHCWTTRRYKHVAITNYGGYPMDRPTVQIGNSLYWVRGHLTIVCCDIENEIIEFIKHPVYYPLYENIPYLGEYQGMLHYAINIAYDKKIFLWRLEQGQWISVKEIPYKFTPVTIQDGTSSGNINTGADFALHALDQERIFLKISEKIVCYNFVRDMVETHMSFDADVQLGYRDVIPYLLPKMPLPVF